jgi:hypothetical protein
MENNDGIIGKAPSYVLEKWKSVKDMIAPEDLLDCNNMAKLNQWKKMWQYIRG